MHTLNGHRKLISFTANYHYYLFLFSLSPFWRIKIKYRFTSIIFLFLWFLHFPMTCKSRKLHWIRSVFYCRHDPPCNCKWCIKYRYKQPNTCDAITSELRNLKQNWFGCRTFLFDKCACLTHSIRLVQWKQCRNEVERKNNWAVNFISFQKYVRIVLGFVFVRSPKNNETKWKAIPFTK